MPGWCLYAIEDTLFFQRVDEVSAGLGVWYVASNPRNVVRWNIREGAELVRAFGTGEGDGAAVCMFIKNRDDSLGWALDLDQLHKDLGHYEMIAAALAEISGLNHEVCYGLLFSGKTADLSEYRKSSSR